MKTDFTAFPYYLDERALRWIEETYTLMTTEEKIGQLFFPIGYSPDPDYLKYEILSKHPGGILFRTGERETMIKTYDFLQKNTRIPLLTAANLESGGTGIMHEGTYYGTQMAVSASGNVENAYTLGRICAEEARAVGVNYAFAPVVDIDINYHNPITNVRTYGKDPETVIEYAKRYMDACRERNVLTAIKHFPGDGVDERDQHICTSVNSLSAKEWMGSYGKVYRALIDHGALTVMVGHIALPSYQSKGKYLPASLSHELVTDLLKEELGFRGLVITDATPMVGFTSVMERKKAVPQSIMAGCDMFLFNKDYAEDYRFMLEGYKEGVLSEDRLKDAVCKILAVKAVLGLHKEVPIPSKEDISRIGCAEFEALASQLADKACTLVKDTQTVLPISPEKHKRVLYEILGDFASNSRVENTFVEEMTKRGYTMIPYERETFDFTKPLPFDSSESFKSKYDLVVYLANIENASNKTTNRINWYTLFGLGNNMPWFVNEVPTIFISLQNPYHLLDVPMVKTYINCYQNNDAMLCSLVEKLNGESAFSGKSPVDPFCGREELKL